VVKPTNCFAEDQFATKLANIINKNRKLLQQKSICLQKKNKTLIYYRLNYNKIHQLFVQKVTNNTIKKSTCLQNDTKWSSDI
jgi:hypothetical protein